MLSKVLTLGKTQKIFGFSLAYSYLCTTKALSRSVAGAIRHERKVRAAQGTPLLKMEAIGDSR